MRRGLDAWPALSDLFAGLLVASFAGLLLFSVIETSTKVQAAEVRNEADRLLKEMLSGLEKGLPGTVRECGPESICFDIDVRFSDNDDRIHPGDAARLRQACEALREVLEYQKAHETQEVSIVIEGHTDSRRISSDYGERARFLHNWSLSAGRAAAVLYEFERSGGSAETFDIMAVGRADSNRICKEDTPECHEQNRRTRFHLRADLQKIRTRLQYSREDPAAGPTPPG